MAIPAAQASVVSSVPPEAVGKAAGTNSMAQELGGVFGIAVLVAVFAAVGSYVRRRPSSTASPPPSPPAPACRCWAQSGFGLPARRRSAWRPRSRRGARPPAADRAGRPMTASRRGRARRLPGRAPPRAHRLLLLTLGSAFDAEDAVQEVLVRAWRSLGSFEGRASACAHGCTASPPTCASTCWDGGAGALLSDLCPGLAPRSVPPGPRGAWAQPMADRLVLDPATDPAEAVAQRESIRWLVAVPQWLLPRQRAVLILRTCCAGARPRSPTCWT